MFDVAEGVCGFRGHFLDALLIANIKFESNRLPAERFDF